ncbi:MAG: hypothetical protein LUD72_13275 [Bacteroidales bacterium]|nr:hypothetical protein [Bacteroidales bacterium]
MRDDEEGKRHFTKFTSTPRQNINHSISDEQCIEMLEQHTITQPVFKALFGDYRSISNNTIAKSMAFMQDFIRPPPQTWRTKPSMASMNPSVTTWEKSTTSPASRP